MEIKYNLNVSGHQDVTVVQEGDMTRISQQITNFDQLLKRDSQGKSVFSYAAGRQPILDYFYSLAESYFIDGGHIVPDRVDSNGRSLLHWAVTCCQEPSVLETLLTAIDVNAASAPYWVTALYQAAQDGNHPALVALLAAHADYQQAAVNGATPLHAAAERGLLANVQALLTAGAAVNAQCKQGGTPLFVAAQKGRTEVVKYFLEHEAIVDQMCVNQATPLYIAVQNGHTDCVALLLAAGADPNQRYQGRIKLIDVAQHLRHSGVIKLLDQYCTV